MTAADSIVSRPRPFDGLETHTASRPNGDFPANPAPDVPPPTAHDYGRCCLQVVASILGRWRVNAGRAVENGPAERRQDHTRPRERLTLLGDDAD